MYILSFISVRSFSSQNRVKLPEHFGNIEVDIILFYLKSSICQLFGHAPFAISWPNKNNIFLFSDFEKIGKMNSNEKEEDDENFDIDDEEHESIDDTPNHHILEAEVTELLNEIEDIVKAEKLSFKNKLRVGENDKSKQETFVSFKRAKKISASQFQVQQAQLMLEKIQQSCPNILASKFKYFNIYIIVPIFISLGNIWKWNLGKDINDFLLGRQTIDRFQQFILEHKEESFLQDFEAEKSEKAVNEHVLR